MRMVNCRKCGKDYDVPTTPNYISICPHCFGYNFCECEYGYGPITPCNIFVGDTEVAQVTGSVDYYLDSEKLGVHKELKQKYKDLAVYYEATDIILEILNNIH